MTTLSPVILPPLSAIYGAITRARLSMYRRGTFRSTKLDRPVVSVGNITTGGTGKTPLVEWVARLLAESGKNVCVLTRGYGRAQANDRVLVSDGKAVFSTPELAGDEAFLLAMNLQGLAAVISDANRIAAGLDAIKHLHTDCFVLDDGFQHLRIVRDLDVVTIDATNPFGGGRLLPEGRLREPLDGLRRAGCIVITRVDQVSETESLIGDIKRYASCPIVTSKMTTRRLVPLNESPGDFEPPIGAFCGVGNPPSFFRHLERSGYEIVFRKALRDHHHYTQDDIDTISQNARDAGAKSLITTAKDAVKLKSLSLPLPCYSLEIEISIDNEQALRSLILNAIDRTNSQHSV